MRFTITENQSAVWISQYLVDDYHRINANSYEIEYLKEMNFLDESGLGLKKLSEITTYISHITGFETEKYINYVEQGIPFIRITNIDNFFVDLSDIKFISEETLKLLPKYHLQLGDILLSKDGTIGKAAIVDKNIANTMSSSHVVTIRVEGVNEYYILTFLNSKYAKSQCDNLSTGSIQRALNVEKIRSLKIPLPSPEIQKYIGDKVRRAEELREEAKQLMKEAKEKMESELKFDVFQEKVKEIKENHDWVTDNNLIHRMDSVYYSPKVMCYERILDEFKIPMITLGNIAKQIRTGTTPQNKFITTEKQSLMFLRMTNINEFIIDMDEVLYVKDDYKGTKLKTMEQDDLLVSIAGTIGRATVVDIDNCTINQNTASITINEKEKYNPYYIALFLNSDIGKMLLERVSSQATVKYINNDVLSEVKIPVIPTEIQLNIQDNLKSYVAKIKQSKQLINQAKQDVEDLIEGNFDMSKLNDTAPESR